MNSADLLLHPVRLRVVKAFLGDRTLTTAEIGAELPDIPKASLYRHVSTLATAGILDVVAERQVRGAVENTYALRLTAARVNDEDVAAMSPDDQTQAFLVYVAGLLADFDRYLADSPAPLQDGASYRVAAMWLSEAEYTDLLHDLAAVLQTRLANAPSQGRRRHLSYHVMLPLPGPHPGHDTRAAN